MDSIRALLKQVTAFWQGKDQKFKRNVIIVAVCALAAIIVASVLLSQVEYAVLYSGLSPTDSTAILTELKAQKVLYKVEGGAILVPAKDADSLRMSLAANIQSGFNNLSIYKQGLGLGATESDKQVYLKYQLEQDLQNSIKTLNGVADARVAITMATSSVLVVDNSARDATAGVILTLKPGVSLSSAQINAIKSFVKMGVSGLKDENISIMDSAMQPLDSGSDGDFAGASDQYALKNSVESSLRKQIMSLLLPVFGVGKVEAQVNVLLNFDDKTVDSTKYTPFSNDKDAVINYYEKLKEQIQNGGDGAGSGEPGTATNTGTATYPTPTGVSTTNGTYEKTEDKVNMLVNQINEHLKLAKGTIQSLSVSVVIDNTGVKTDLSDNVKNLVKNAVGASLDSISVEYMPMTASQSLSDEIKAASAAEKAAATAKQYVPYAILGAATLVILILMILVFSSRKAKQRAEMEQKTAVLTAEAAASEELQQMEDELAAIKIVKESGTKEQIGNLIEKNPELVANLLRSWLAEDQD